MVGIPTIGLFLLATGFYNRSSAVVARASVSRGRQANPVLTCETALRRFFCDTSRRVGQSDDDGGRWVRQPPKVGKWRTSGTQRLVSRRIPARYAALCVPGYGRVPSLCDERVQTDHVLTYTTALRRFFPYGGDASRRNEVFVMRLFCVGFCKIGK